MFSCVKTETKKLFNVSHILLLSSIKFPAESFKGPRSSVLRLCLSIYFRHTDHFVFLPVSILCHVMYKQIINSFKHYDILTKKQ